MRLFLLCAVAAFGQDVTKLSWMAGSWTGTRGRATIEEHWTQPNGNAMLAVSKTVAGGKMVEFEFIKLVVKDGAIVYAAQAQWAAANGLQAHVRDRYRGRVREPCARLPEADSLRPQRRRSHRVYRRQRQEARV